LRGGGFHKNETVYLFKERERERDLVVLLE